MPSARSSHAIAIVVALAFVFGARPAAADDKPRGAKRLTVDRVIVERSPLFDLVRMRLFVSAIDLDTIGSVIAVSGANAFALGGNAGIKKAPYVAGTFAAADTEAALVVVLQTSGELEADLDAIKAAIREELLAPLDSPKLPRTQAAVIGYADEIETAKLTTVAQAQDQLDKLASSGAPSEAPALLDAVGKAVKLLVKARPAVEGAASSSLRKMVVVVSDGRDAAEDRDATSRLAKKADNQGIRIHTVGYSPQGKRRPLFTLGELSKVSQGTFRWIQRKVDESSLRAPFKKLREEIERQYVLTVFVPEEDLPRKLTVSTAVAGKPIEGTAKVPKIGCGTSTCATGQYCVAARCVSRRGEEGRGFFGWILLLGGVAVAGLALLVATGFVITKVRERRARAPAPVTAAPAAAAAAAPAPAPAPVMTTGPVLFVLSGPQTGQRIPLRHGFLIGKAPNCDLSLAHDGYASGHHAQILMDAVGNCQLVDQGSTNGTFINGVRVTEQRLNDGMSIRCGSTELRFLARS